MERPNLTVETHLQVERVVLDGMRAVAVEGQRLGEALRFEAAREVILSGGTYNSPQLLMQSGIGATEHLAARLIEPVLDRPMVGRNLQDHVNVWAPWRSREAVSLATAMAPDYIDANVACFEEQGTGPLTSNVAEAGVFVRTSADLGAPDFFSYTRSRRFSARTRPSAWPSTASRSGSRRPTPSSVGELYLSGPEPTGKPLIYHRYLET